MNDQLDLVRALEPGVAPLGSVQIERQRARLVTAARAEATGGEPARPLVTEEKSARTTPARRRRSALLAGGFAISTTALVVIALVVLLPGRGHSSTAAAAVLEQAAAVVGQESPGPGQFLYNETQSSDQVTTYRSSATTGPLTRVATATYGETDQSWTDASGNGEVLRTYGAAAFSSPADEAAWDARMAASGLRTFGGQAQPEAPPLNVSGLPTDPAALVPVLAAGELGTGQYIAPGPDATFERAARLLLGPTTGMSPTLASALFEVMAGQPDAQLLGATTDHNGQQGEGVALGDAGSTEVAEVIVDPEQGRLLEADFAVPGAVSSVPESTCSTKGASSQCIQPVGEEIFAPVWTDLVASGIVGSNTATVPASGTATITATQVPGAPTGLVATPENGTVDLSWVAPVDQGASAVTHYVVYTGTPGSPGNRGLQDTQSAATSYAWSFSPPGQPVSFTVQAVNAQGGGPLSTSMTVTP